MTVTAVDFQLGAARAAERRRVRGIINAVRRRRAVAELIADPPPCVAQLPLSRVLLWGTDSITHYLQAAGCRGDRPVWALTADQRQAVTAALNTRRDRMTDHRAGSHDPRGGR